MKSTMQKDLSIEKLFSDYDFTPNKSQKKAIETLDGPLFLTAGPGSGKTRVILWRTLNLIVFHDVKPEEIFLATFTEKAALQLKQGLQSLLSLASTYTHQPYDIGRMYIGTLHSLCQKLLSDRHLNISHVRQRQPILLDELSQFLFVYNTENFQRIVTAGQLKETGRDLYYRINEWFSSGGFGTSGSRTDCASNLISFFNRLSEEDIPFEDLNSNDELEHAMFRMYIEYKDMLKTGGNAERVDFSCLQQAAYHYLCSCSGIEKYIKYVIVDEYQDTNTIQEKIYFKLAEKSHNICVVGDDDQALYRFRGATVENLVFFDKKCQQYLGVEPVRIDLNINYRSRKQIVDTYTSYIEGGNWKNPKNPKIQYRLDKDIKAHSTDSGTSVLHVSGSKDSVAEQIADLVKELKERGKITDYNQCAFLFPSVRSMGETNAKVIAFEKALKDRDIPVYAPRAKNFLNVSECLAVFGVMSLVFEPNINEFNPAEKPKFKGDKFTRWMAACRDFAQTIVDDDPLLEKFIEDYKKQTENSLAVYKLLLNKLSEKSMVEDGKLIYTGEVNTELTTILSKTRGLPDAVVRLLAGRQLNSYILRKNKEGKPVGLAYVLARCTSLDWTVLDLFYRMTCFDHFRAMFDAAQSGEDEGPMFNLGMITQYLAKFMETHNSILSGSSFMKSNFCHQFWDSYLYSLFNRGETEYEDADDPFPKGNVPFLTVHQSKGLEFPVVILASINRSDKGPRQLDVMVRKLLKPKNAEPLEMTATYDSMRMFYVALSRAKNLTVIVHETKKAGGNQALNHQSFVKLFNETAIPTLDNFDVNTLPDAKENDDALPKVYSYTADYLPYLNCPRNYMVFRRYGFVPSRGQTMFFGSLVHQTIDDLQQAFNAAKGV